MNCMKAIGNEHLTTIDIVHLSFDEQHSNPTAKKISLIFLEKYIISY